MTTPEEWGKAFEAVGRPFRTINESGEMDAPPCVCGCGNRAREGSKYHIDKGPGNCKSRLFDLRHPRLDLGEMDPGTAKRAERMVAEAVEAARQGLSRATVDSSHPVKHEKDERPSCRVRLSPEAWEWLTELVEAGWGGNDVDSRSSAVEAMIGSAYSAWSSRQRAIEERMLA